MATSGLPYPAEFQPVPGEPPVPWARWIKSFENFLVAGALEEASESRKKAILLHLLGEEGRRRAANVDASKSLQETKTALKAIFSSSRSVIAERFAFRQRAQHDGESIGDYVMALRELATNCKFGTFHDEIIRDQLVEKTCVPRIRERLLMEEDDLTLDDAIKKAERIEAAIRDAKQVSGPELHVKALSKKPKPAARHEKTAAAGPKCTRCGGNHGHKGECKAMGQKCRRCGKTNHFAKMCRMKAVSAIDTKEPAESSLTVLAVNNKSTDSLFCECRLGGQLIRLQIDCGAAVSLLNMETFKKSFARHPLLPTSTKLEAYGGSAIKTIGKVELPVTFNGIRTEATFYVADKGANILGRDLFQALGFKIFQGDNRVMSISETTIERDFPGIFDGLGRSKSFIHRTKIDASVKPVSQPMRKLPIGLKDEVTSEISRMEQQGIIEKVDASEWVSNVVVTRKKESNKVRLCVDLRQVNKAVIADRYPVPSIEDLSASINGSKCFSKLDLRQGYQQIPLHPDSRGLTCFITDAGLYQFTVVPFGLSSSGAAFQRALQTVLRGAPGAINIVDDILVHGKDETEHDKNLREVLGRIHREGFTLNREKCKFRQASVDFFGLVISADGIKPTKCNVDAILRIPEPSTVAQIQSFLGAVNFLHKFIPHYSAIAEPLRQLLKKDADWHWGERERTAFRTLKSAVTSSPVLAHFDCQAETYVTCDASLDGLGAVLSQVQNGKEVPIAFASRALSPAEKRYSAGEREALACVWSIERWHYYLYGRRVTLRTDHKALTTLLDSKGMGHRPLRIHRWVERLRGYDVRFEHIPGADNKCADMLSRWATTERVPAEETDEEGYVYAVVDSKTTLTADALATATKEDEVLQAVLQYISGGWPTKVDSSLKPYFNVRDELFCWNNGQCLGRGERAIIPTSLRLQVIEEAHEGHPGVVRSKQRCRDTVWFPGIDRQVEDYVKNCTACTLAEKSGKPQQTIVTPIEWPDGPWDKVEIDIFGEVAAAPRHQRFLLVIHDLYSKWPEIAAMETVTSANIIKTLRKLFGRWGVPKMLISDNGPQFVSDEFEEFLRAEGIKHSRVSRYYPQGNGGVERFNRSLKEGLAANLRAGAKFEDAIDLVLKTYRSSQHALTGLTPAELMIGRKLRSGLQLLRPTPVQQRDDSDLRDSIAQRQAKNADYTNKRRRARDSMLQAGDWVWRQTPHRAHKLATRLKEPLKIASKAGRNTFVLSDGTKWQASRLVKCNSPPADNGAADQEDDWFDLPLPPAPPPRTGEPPPPPERRRSTRARRQPARYPLPEGGRM
ncbi:hypothetical protein BOX15_Mlig004385g26 [Macrostomum lignano]|uniref:Reverse transcriptase n=1 Tax=Macrostomum lignano TaxID=282301 RepID=A0A267E4Z3_9PLAT|nr:hypothetical protein BOX15_Mlig004385g26 [Macrostomum lignano]